METPTMRTLKEREKMPALRIGEESINHVRSKYADGTPEREFFENVLLARIPYALIAKLSNLPHTDVRDMVTGRKAYTDDARVILCEKINKLVDKGLDIGIYPCSDLAVIDPMTTVLLSSMANERRFEIAKQKLIEAGLMPAQ